ncbi:MAG TPA: hypothetical protein VL308_08980 [Gemmatimonadaceae bacterium]|jgi:hypothetical protein|nr:hypothetical protein [Gemmatimonadaceae bacterium]
MYSHTQRSAPALFLFSFAALALIAPLLGGALAAAPAGARIAVIAAAIVMVISAFAFSSLTIAVREGQLSWWFGPGLVKKTVPLSTIVSAEPTTTSILNGWGIHFTGRGWLYNVAGRQAVLVTRQGGKRFLLGTDEPDSLAHIIMSSR